jgi:2-dehydro-3-deoxygalactonokinase
MRVITIDSGTTNTRAYLVEDGRVLAAHSRSVGSRDTAIDGDNAKLTAGVRELIDLLRAEAPGANIEAVIASGMITSNMGLCEIPHLPAPVDLTKLAASLQRRVIDTASPEPILFIPGVKTVPATADPFRLDCDMMRGEETETFGILAGSPLTGDTMLILPGSHSKFVEVDGGGAITGSVTTLAGELAWAIRKETILANSLARDFACELDQPALLKGADHCRLHGLNQACFATRIAHVLGDTSEAARTSFLLGAIFYQDIVALKNKLGKRPTNIVIGGKRLFRDIYFHLLNRFAPASWTVSRLSDQAVADAVPLGAWTLWRRHMSTGR